MTAQVDGDRAIVGGVRDENRRQHAQNQVSCVFIRIDNHIRQSFSRLTLFLKALYINGVVVLVSSPWVPESSLGQLSRCKPGGQNRCKAIGDIRSERILNVFYTVPI